MHTIRRSLDLSRSSSRFSISPLARPARSFAFGRSIVPHLVLLVALSVLPAPFARAQAPAADATPAAAGLGACAEGEGERAAQQIQKRYEGVRDLAAGFSQTSESATFGGRSLMDDGRKTGQVVFAKPGKMRWEYASPEPSVVVSNGETLWIYDVGGASVTRLSVTAGFLSGAALQFLLGDGQLLESFAVEAIGCEAGRVHLDLEPKADATYERLGLVADRKTGDVVATSVTDLFGNRTRIEFEDLKVNAQPDPSVFDFVVPEGVELIEYEGSLGG